MQRRAERRDKVYVDTPRLFDTARIQQAAQEIEDLTPPNRFCQIGQAHIRIDDAVQNSP
jgi:hypothetical protein